MKRNSKHQKRKEAAGNNTLPANYMCYAEEYNRFLKSVSVELMKYGIKEKETVEKAKSCSGMFDGTGSKESIEQAVRFCLGRISLLYIPPRGLLQAREKYGDPDGRINDFIVTVIHGLDKNERESFYGELGVKTRKEAFDKYGLKNIREKGRR